MKQFREICSKDYNWITQQRSLYNVNKLTRHKIGILNRCLPGWQVSTEAIFEKIFGPKYTNIQKSIADIQNSSDIVINRDRLSATDIRYIKEFLGITDFKTAMTIPANIITSKIDKNDTYLYNLQKRILSGLKGSYSSEMITALNSLCRLQIEILRRLGFLSYGNKVSYGDFYNKDFESCANFWISYSGRLNRVPSKRLNLYIYGASTWYDERQQRLVSMLGISKSKQNNYIMSVASSNTVKNLSKQEEYTYVNMISQFNNSILEFNHYVRSEANFFNEMDNIRRKLYSKNNNGIYNEQIDIDYINSDPENDACDNDDFDDND